MTVTIGRLQPQGRRFAIVVSRFNEFITRRLLDSAREVLEQAGVRREDIDVTWVPGALEIPQICATLGRAAKHDALIALGCVIRGETYHYECVAHEVTRGISQAGLETGTPIATGVLTVENLEQAIDRAGLKAGNKGGQAALVALEMADLNCRLGGRRRSREERSAAKPSGRRKRSF